MLPVHCPQYQREIQRWKVYSCPSPDLQRGLHVEHQVDETTPTAEPILIDTRGEKKCRCASSVNGREGNALYEWSGAHV